MAIRDSLIRDRIVEGVLSYELRGELLKKPDLALQETAALQDYKFSTLAGAGTERSIGIQPVNMSRERDKKALRSSKFCG